MAEQRRPGGRGGVDLSSLPPDAEDGRWGVARLVAQREAERRARERAAAAPPLTEDAPLPAEPPASAGSTAAPAEALATAPPTPPAPRRPESPVPPAPRAPVPVPPMPRPPLPAPRRPYGGIPQASDPRAPRPRVEPDPSLFGFARRTRSRRGSRMFWLFFALVFAVIVIQTVASIV
ncbi:MAG: hypothetical protein ABW212_16455 [Pseudonocardia sediminis]